MACVLLDNIEAYPQNPDTLLFVNVTLFELEDFNGSSQTFTIEPEICFEVPEDIGHDVGSAIIGDDDCVKFFTGTDCTGNSVCACGEKNFPDGDPFKDNIGSIRLNEVDSTIKKCDV
ncbi:hypothetical protein RclHR1_16940001 [Rhizophagus clarus]|nr:hypothetical protein RclHR1_16940001 [Rhizophagus clarus]